MSYQNYILTIDPNSEYDIDVLKKQLNKCIDWTRLHACTYVLNTTSNKEELYDRFKIALPDNKFFIANLFLSNNDYTGWLNKNSWTRLKEFKEK